MDIDEFTIKIKNWRFLRIFKPAVFTSSQSMPAALTNFQFHKFMLDRSWSYVFTIFSLFIYFPV